MSVFAKAKKIEAPVSGAKKKDDKARINIAGLANYAIIDKVVKSFTALQKTLGETVKEDIADTFIGIGKQTKKRPDNFRGVDGNKVEASCELRCRASTSPLTPEEVEQLEGLGLPVGEVVSQEECFIFNPAVIADPVKMEKISKALEKCGIEDVVLLQPCVKKRVVTQETLDTVFQKGLAESLLDLVGVLAIKPTYNGTLVEALAEAKALAGLVDAEPAKTKKGK